jgi:Ser/Thr protein kinase RdoA (MazF antagonist)
MSDLAWQLAGRYRLHDIGLRPLAVPVNDVVAVTATEGEFALKLYHRNRTREAVQWEVDLLVHLLGRGAPVARPIPGRNGHLELFETDGQQRVAVLFSWAPGSKPGPSEHAYGLLGEAAGRIHRAADGFPPSAVRENYDAASLVDDQLRRMRPLLEQAGRWRSAVGLAERLQARLARTALDRGICHMDLTLDNVHLAEDMTVFDFDSAGECWRAIEPWGVLKLSAAYFQAWLAGYRTVRGFGPAEEQAVATFAVIADLRGVAWKLGVAASSRGIPPLGSADLPAIVDGWLRWEAECLTA